MGNAAEKSGLPKRMKAANATFPYPPPSFTVLAEFVKIPDFSLAGKIRNFEVGFQPMWHFQLK